MADSRDQTVRPIRDTRQTHGTHFFFYFALVIAATSVLVVALRNPIYSALALLIMFFHVAGLYVTLHAEFLAAVQIIVYAGAILVLYLFVVMLLNLKTGRPLPPAMADGCGSGRDVGHRSRHPHGDEAAGRPRSWQPAQKPRSGQPAIPRRSVTSCIPPICFPSRWPP